MDLLQPSKVNYKRILLLSKICKKNSPSTSRKTIFDDKNAIKPDLGIFKAKIGKLYIGWERVSEFYDVFWDFIWSESSHTA